MSLIFFCLLSQGDTGPPGSRGNTGRDGKRVRIQLHTPAVLAESSQRKQEKIKELFLKGIMGGFYSTKRFGVNVNVKSSGGAGFFFSDGFGIAHFACEI